jgi:hypothetical protein
MEFLATEGYRPSLDSDGDIRFKHDGGHYLIHLESGDDQYVSVVFPRFWPLESQEEIARAFRAANRAGTNTKVAKVEVLEEQKDVWAEIELLIERPEQLEEQFHRVLALIQGAVDEFAAQMRASAPLADRRVALARGEVTRFLAEN